MEMKINLILEDEELEVCVYEVYRSERLKHAQLLVGGDDGVEVIFDVCYDTAFTDRAPYVFNFTNTNCSLDELRKYEALVVKAAKGYYVDK